MGGWILPTAIDTQDADDMRWNAVVVSFQVYPWAMVPLGKPKFSPWAPRVPKRKVEEEIREAVPESSSEIPETA